MIISDKFRFAFVHIPKCAGVSVKKALVPIDGCASAFSRIGDHPVLGRIHFAHIPLDALAAHWPDHFAKVADYRSVAIVRDPSDRFVSAIFQRLREFKGFDQSKITPEVVDAEAREVISYLEKDPDWLDLEHVHFNRQTAFVSLAGKPVVRHVFALHQLDRAADFIESCTGVRIADEKLNRSLEFSFQPLKPLVAALRRPLATILPLSARNAIRDRLVKSGFYGTIDRERFFRPGSRIDSFLREYYRSDFEIYQACVDAGSARA